MKLTKKTRSIILIAGDFIVGAISIFLAMYARYSSEFTTIGFVRYYTGAITIALLVPPFVFYLAELYGSSVNMRESRWNYRLLGATFISFLVLIAIYYWFPSWKMYRGALSAHVISFAILIVIWRHVHHHIPFLKRAPSSAIFTTYSKNTQNTAEMLSCHPDVHLKVLGFMDTNTENEQITLTDGSKLDLSNPDEAGRIDAIIYDPSHLSEKIIRVLLSSKLKGIQIYDIPTVYKLAQKKLPVFQINDFWLMTQSGFDLLQRPFTKRVQRIMDVVVSSMGLLIALPLMLLAAFGVLVSMGRPIFFKQDRVGLNEQEFTLVKFRTMKKNAEEKSGPMWSQGPNDSRVTGFGKFLRRTRIDELPQLWNVLIGEMSFVGPRPERKHFTEQLKKEIPYYSLRFTTKPGLSGWAQVNYGYGATTEDAIEKLQYELYYIQEMSLLLNLIIVFKTIQTVLFKRGS